MARLHPGFEALLLCQDSLPFLALLLTAAPNVHRPQPWSPAVYVW